MTSVANSRPSPEGGEGESNVDPAWGTPAHNVSRWPALIAVLAALVLYVTLPEHLYYGPIWLLPGAEALLFVALLVARGVEDEGHRWQRTAIMGLIGVMNVANVGSLLLLLHALVASTPVHGHKIVAQSLMIWAGQIWLTNVLVFGLWYWELDRGGPVMRSCVQHDPPDLLFPQMVNPDAAPRGWTPSFLDYLYTSFTNATAFSPTDTMPLTAWAKILFMLQSAASLVTVGLVVARIANILP
jgi:hypothetical protein